MLLLYGVQRTVKQRKETVVSLVFKLPNLTLLLHHHQPPVALLQGGTVPTVLLAKVL
jgi:hypothetical protein